MASIVECVPGVEQIPFAQWHEAGVQCLLFDMDGTLNPYGSVVVPQEIIDTLVTSRERDLYKALGIVTHNKDHSAIKKVAKQVGADSYFSPNRWSDRKPRPVLIELALTEFGFEPSETGMTGDKFTADVRAGVKAGVSRIAWVDRLGATDAIGDRVLRRPYEDIVYRRVLERQGPQEFMPGSSLVAQITRMALGEVN